MKNADIAKPAGIAVKIGVLVLPEFSSVRKSLSVESLE
jgi:hypothetical protein